MDRPPHVAQSGAELEEFFDLSVDLLCIVGFDGYFKRVNAALERTLGYPKPELFSRSVFDITHPDDIARSREGLAQLGEGRPGGQRALHRRRGAHKRREARAPRGRR